MTPSPHTSLVEMAQGYFRGKVLCAAVRLGLPDALGTGGASLDDLAAATSSHPGTLLRLLRGLASFGVVAEVSPLRFALTELGEPLRRDAPHSVWASIVFWSDLLADAWTYLPDCVQAGGREGNEAARARNGDPSRWSQDPNSTAIFHAAFAEPSAADLAPTVAAYDFGRFPVVADLGAAGGGLLAAVLAAAPGSSGVWVDRPQALGAAAKRLSEAGPGSRCRFVPGDLLDEVPPGADLYILSRVLHGYEEGAIQRILRNGLAAMGPAGRLLIIETVLPETIDPSDPWVERRFMSDLNMLAVTGGRERTEPEWKALLEAAGFQLLRRIDIPESTTSLLEAAPQTE